ncbi:MAG: copper chaperone PCu(A)C [Pseudonocardiales bacterium]
MSRRPQLIRSPITLAARIVACCAAALMLTSCGAGLTAQTASQAAAVDGANADLGAIALRDVLMPYPEEHHGTYPSGSDVPVHFTIVNETTSADTLISVTTPAARQVLLQGTTTIPAGMAVRGDTDPSGMDPSGMDPNDPAANPAAPANPLDIDELRIVLVDATRPLRPGLNIELTFVFRDAGPVTLSVPMGPPRESERLPLEVGEH